ncbi:hypothetical protein [Hyphomicrobium sp. CS1GBMeth3]|uniref:hypothetical protein n=1 Tax=Hyphomicrobium sp. CS1GBMeth3 TaxID=1892845 RepID=UPI0009319483|nr:hypothetical protein [Hyphomicrobium sp. CS1GBMeth3]
MVLTLGLVAVGLLSSAQAQSPPVELKRADAVALVMSTFVRLNDANMSANYSVLRSTSAPDFQTRFSERNLELMFEGMRIRRIDLSKVVSLQPAIVSARFHTDQKILQLIGFVETRPIQTKFAFSYTNYKGSWLLYGLAIDFEAVPQSLPKLQQAEGAASYEHR